MFLPKSRQHLDSKWWDFSNYWQLKNQGLKDNLGSIHWVERKPRSGRSCCWKSLWGNGGLRCSWNSSVSLILLAYILQLDYQNLNTWPCLCSEAVEAEAMTLSPSDLLMKRNLCFSSCLGLPFDNFVCQYPVRLLLADLCHALHPDSKSFSTRSSCT